MARPVFALALAALVAPPLSGQSEADLPRIVTAGSAEVRLPADYAVLLFGIEVTAPTTGGVADTMNVRFSSLNAALLAFGFAQDSLPTHQYSISPRFEFEDGVRRPVGYDGVASVRVTQRDLAELMTLIRACLDAGATTVTGLTFHADDARPARDEAIRRAVAEARADAAAIAAATGRSLGELREVQTIGRQADIGYSSAITLTNLVVGGASAPITPREIVVRATVYATFGMN